MKKTYEAPETSVLEIAPVRPIAGSTDIQSDKGIGYGGVDTEGSLDPSARRHRDVWYDEEEDDDGEK